MSSVIQVTSVDYPETDGKPMGETDNIGTKWSGRSNCCGGSTRTSGLRVGQPARVLQAGQSEAVRGPGCVCGQGARTTAAAGLQAVGRAANRRDRGGDVAQDEKDGHDHQAQAVLPLGVKEYFLFDPTQDYLEPPLQGYRLDGDRYQRIAADARKTGEQGAGAVAAGRKGQLMFYRIDTGERLLTEREARRRPRRSGGRRARQDGSRASAAAARQAGRFAASGGSRSRSLARNCAAATQLDRVNPIIGSVDHAQASVAV